MLFLYFLLNSTKSELLRQKKISSVKSCAQNTENTKRQRKSYVLFCTSCYSEAWIQCDITAVISEATHSIGTNTVNIHIESN